MVYKVISVLQIADLSKHVARCEHFVNPKGHSLMIFCDQAFEVIDKFNERKNYQLKITSFGKALSN